jgi:Uma2 family endonuclease
MICCEPNKFIKAKYKGIPALIVEILSYSTQDRDKNIKFNVYQNAGVPEYWIVDINESKITVYSNNNNGEYNTSNIYTIGKKFKSFNNVEFKVDEIFAVLK